MKQDSDSRELSDDQMIFVGSLRTSSIMPSSPPEADIFSSHAFQSGDLLRHVRFESAGRFAVTRWAPIPLRLIVGYGFMAHGFAKLSRGPDAFAAILHAIGVPAPYFMAWATIMTELLGGIAFLFGAFTTLISLPTAVLLLVAIFTVHLPYGFSSIKLIAVTPAGAQFGPPGYECDLLYLACLTALVLGGSGPLAVDELLRKRRIVASTNRERHQ